MGRIFVTSDLHIGHDQDFLYEPRGFVGFKEHDKMLVDNWNSVVKSEDTIYVLGDVMLSNKLDDEPFQYGLNVLRQLNGRLIILRGNHDSEQRIELYKKCENVESAGDAALYLKYPEIGGYTFYMSHYPTIVTHKKLKRVKDAIINLHGHTHQKEHFFNIDGVDNPFMYCVCLDAHNHKPVLLDDVIEEIKDKRGRWNNLLLAED